MDRGAWQAAVLRVAQSRTLLKQLSRSVQIHHIVKIYLLGEKRVSFEKSNKNPTFHSLWLDKTQLNSHI